MSEWNLLPGHLPLLRKIVYNLPMRNTVLMLGFALAMAGYELVNLHGTGTYLVANPLQPVDNAIEKGLSISDVRFLGADRLSDHMALSCVLTDHPK